MFENPRRGREARNLTTNVPKILDLVFRTDIFRKLMVGAPGCLLLPSPSSLLALNFKSAFSLQRLFRCQIFPCEDLQLVVEFGVLVFAVLFHLHEKSL